MISFCYFKDGDGRGVVYKIGTIVWLNAPPGGTFQPSQRHVIQCSDPINLLHLVFLFNIARKSEQTKTCPYADALKRGL